MMTTIHLLSGEDSLVLRMRKHPGNKSTNASGANSTVLPGECQRELDIPVIVNVYNHDKVGVNVADQYRNYFDTQLITKCNEYPLLYWILETARISSPRFYRNHPVIREHTIEHFDLHLSIVCDFQQSWNSINNDIFLPWSGCTTNHFVSSHHTICFAPTAYPASHHAHRHSSLLRDTRNAFPGLVGV
jgi:hypothetical protein